MALLPYSRSGLHVQLDVQGISEGWRSSRNIWHGILSEMGMVVISSVLAVGPIAQTLDDAGRPIGAPGASLEKAFGRFADDLAWWTEAAREQPSRRPTPY